MHVARGAWRNLFAALALVTLALPLASSQLATPIHAQTTTDTQLAGASISISGAPCSFTSSTSVASDANCIAAATPALAFNPIGDSHTVTFTCGLAAGTLTGGTGNAGVAGVGPEGGCFNVTASVNDETSGSAATITSARCGNNATGFTSSSVDCGPVESPICPVGFRTDFTVFAPAPPCNVRDTNGGFASQVAVTINPSAPHAYLFQFHGYTLLNGACTGGYASTGTNGRGTCTTASGAAISACPAGETYQPGPFNVYAATGAAPFETQVTLPDGACAFTITAEKKYFEITSVQLTPISGPCTTGAASPSSLLFAEGLKAYFGRPCHLVATVTGIVVLKSGVDCNAEPGPNSGTPLGFPSQPAVVVNGVTVYPAVTSNYQCINGTLSVKITGLGTGIGANAGGTDIGPIGITVNNAVENYTTDATTLGSLCAGTTGTVLNTVAGDDFFVCPVGPGSGTISACVTGGAFGPPDTQPAICSNNVNFTYVVPAQQRVVPLVRWAGEKAVLTKCFGGAGLYGGSLVEFTLEGAGSDAQASLLPASLGGTVGSVSGGEPVTAPSQNTVITQTDADGCATVIVYAASEGVVNVDASIYSAGVTGTPGTANSTAPLLNEHAFEIFYLKFDHVDLENIKFNTYKTDPVAELGFSGDLPGFPGYANGHGYTQPASYSLPNAPGTNPPGANGYQIPLCKFDYMRAWVHGYFEYPGDPSGRPAATVSIPGNTGTTAGSYTLPAGRWVLPEDWPVLATFAGFNSNTGTANVSNPSSVYSFDLNSGWVFNPDASKSAGGELPVVCAGTSATPAVGTGAIANNYGQNVSYGPCYGQDITEAKRGTAAANGGTNFYNTGPDLDLNFQGANCIDGLTVGIGPFDPTQACTDPYPLTFSPEGSGVITTTGTGGGPDTAFAFVPISENSTYLPNATVNEWDAPMPPAQVTFQITGGPGFLGQVNKTSLYSIAVTDPTTGNTSGAIYPDPFYAEAIPASPLIPPVANDGGYLWDTFGATNRGVLALGSVAAPGGFVAGESTSVTASDIEVANGGTAGNTSTLCGNNGLVSSTGLTFVAGGAPASTGACFVGTGGTANTTVTLSECNAIGGTFTVVTPAAGAVPAYGTCEVPAPAQNNATEAGGINLTNFGANCPTIVGGPTFPSDNNTVVVANGNGFVPGMTVEVYSSVNGRTLATGLQLTAVTPTGNGNAATLTLSVPSTNTLPSCVAAGQGIFVSEDLAITTSANTNQLSQLGQGGLITVTTPSGQVFNGYVATPYNGTSTSSFPVNTATGTIYLANAEAIARALGNCVLSRGPIGGPVAFGTCEPASFLPAGSIVVSSPNPVIGTNGSTSGPPLQTTPFGINDPLFGGQGPYPFWQWVPAPSSGAVTNRNATMYTDNHGEAIVALQTGIASAVVPANGACPANYLITPNGLNCLLDLTTLANASAVPGGTPFQNVVAAGAYNASTPGCITTTPSGGTTATTQATPVVGAQGPADNQICVNTLGGIEFGKGATLGTTTVQAIADYPYFRLHPAVSSGTINKIFTSLWNKSVTVTTLPGGTAGPAGTSSYTVTISGTDICGNPIVGEPVQVFALTGAAGAVVLAPQGAGGTSNGTGAATVYLDATGHATLSLEVLGNAIGNSGLVIKAVFPLERVERFVTVIAGQSTNQTTQQLYPPGYNMVGGPAGTNFGSAEALFTYNPTSQQYAAASTTNVSSAAPTCTGYWAYFASATAVQINVTSQAGATATCNLQAGWNLVGNPFSSNAILPSGVTAYHYNPSNQTYDVVGSIPLGGAVFIYEASATTVTLTAS